MREGLGDHSPGARIGSDLGTYSVEEKISQGKHGFTFAGHDGGGNPCILQVLRPFSMDYGNARERWLQQVAELRRLRHPHLVDLRDGFEHEGCFHLVHERCSDRLDQRIDSPAWDGSRWFKIVARPVLCALEEAHAKGYVHRNLHPRNVFLNLPPAPPDSDPIPDGTVKLADLASNTLLGKVDVLNMRISRWLVPPEYLSPSECGPMDHRLDIYQAGLLLLGVLRGRIRRYSWEEIAMGQPARDAERLGAAPGHALAQALQTRVEDRFPSALEMWSALSPSQPLFGPETFAQTSDQSLEIR